MKACFPLLASTLLLVQGSLPAQAAEPTGAALVPDENLRAVVLELKKKRQKPGDDVTIEDLRGIYVLNAKGRGIRDLTGLQHCYNLGNADLSDNAIQDVSPLSACRSLQLLDLAHNEITDVTPLGKIEKLQYLNVAHNQIEELDGLEPLQALTCLYASHNRIASIEPVAQLKKLWTLDLNHNQIRDISPVADLSRLDSLGLAHNDIDDVSPLPGGSGMYTTFLHGNRIADISPLVEMARRDAEGEKRFAPFWRLYLAGNPIPEETKSRHVAELKKAGVQVDLEYNR
jgi:Leucine-rich repeat (LRR) protein